MRCPSIVAESIVAKPKKPWRCWVGWHTWFEYEAVWVDVFGTPARVEDVRVCVWCQKRSIKLVG